MDIELARTFLEIVATGGFSKAAERLHVGQTTVSARVRLLEQQLGRPLFIRNKAGASLTPAGEQFLRFAPGFVQLWQRARHQVAVPPGHRAVLTIGSEISLWQPLLLNWVRRMRYAHPEIALRVHVDVPQDLITHVAAGFVDIAIMYAPQHRPGLTVDLVVEEKLVLVTTEPGTRPHQPEAKYVHVEWGSEFAHYHDVSFPDLAPSVYMNLGPLALSYILLEGGSGYFRLNAVQQYLDSGELFLVQGAPHFSFPVYVAHTANVESKILESALSALHAVSAEPS